MNVAWFLAGVAATITIEFIVLFIAAIVAVMRANEHEN